MPEMGFLSRPQSDPARIGPRSGRRPQPRRREAGFLRVAVARFALARAGAFRVVAFRVVAVFARAGRFAVVRLAVFLVEVLVEVARFEVVRAAAFVFDATVFDLADRFIAVARPPDFFEVFDCLAITVLHVDPAHNSPA